MESETRSKTCRTCGEPFYGRLNQDYCSKECRFEFNNVRARENKEQISSILKILLKNREILKEIYEAGITEIFKTELKSKRYNFIYLTHQLKSESKKDFIFCFEFGFSISNDTLTLTKHDGIF